MQSEFPAHVERVNWPVRCCRNDIARLLK